MMQGCWKIITLHHPRTEKNFMLSTSKIYISNPFGHDLLTLGEASFLTSYAKYTIRRWIHKGYLKRYGSVRRVLVHFDELMTFLSERKTPEFRGNHRSNCE